MPDPVFLDAEAVLALYDDLRATYGVGIASINEGLLQGALGRVPDNFYYRNPCPTVPELAGLLGYSIAKAHPFGDGNKRTALASMDLFLVQNGWVNMAPDIELATKVEAVVANEISEAEFIAWIADGCVSFNFEDCELDP